MSSINKELVIPAEVDRLADVLSFLEQMLEEANFSMKAQMQISVAAEEIFVNIAHYAYTPETGMVTVRVEISDNLHRATVTFIDSGIPFDPLKKTDPDVTLSAEERNIGGLGIYMTKKTMDEVHYEYKDGKNILMLIKNS